MDENKSSIRSLVELMLIILILVSIIGGFICGILAYNTTIFTDEENAAYSDSLMDRNTYLRLGQIGHEYGGFARIYYQYIYIYNDQKGADEMYKRGNNSSNNQIKEAISKNFLVPINPERDEKIMNRYEQLQSARDSLERKINPRNRFKDTMAWIGGMFSLFLITFLSFIALMHLRGNALKLKITGGPFK